MNGTKETLMKRREFMRERREMRERKKEKNRRKNFLFSKRFCFFLSSCGSGQRARRQMWSKTKAVRIFETLRRQG